VIFGPHTYNFEQAAEGAMAAGAGMRVADASAAISAATELTADGERRARMGQNALGFVQAHRGATRRLLARLEAARARP
jgi:3-deoxy-D-manno-octulosonic-acid transferase